LFVDPYSLVEVAWLDVASVVEALEHSPGIFIN
jgi:hypothetical protein